MEPPTKRLFFNYFFIFLYLELLFKIVIFGFKSVFTFDTVMMIMFILPISMFFTLISKVFKAKINVFLVSIFTFIICFWYGIELFIKRIFNSFFSISSLSIAGQVADFKEEAVSMLLSDWWIVLLLFVPFIYILMMNKKIDLFRYHRVDWLKNGLVFLAMILVFFLVSFFTKSVHQTHKLFYYEVNNDLNIEKMGVSAGTYLEVKRIIIPFEESIVINPKDKPSSSKKEEPEEIVYKPNILNIDFETMISNEKGKTLKRMHEYFNNDTGTLQNEYTGFFKGKNLIYIVAESFSDIAVSENLTPTLYKLTNESFVFENFYTPVNLSTIGGEFQAITGYFADLAVLGKQWKTGSTNNSFGLAHKFKEINYNTYAFHNHTYVFQSRHVYLKSLGFDNYIGCKNGMEKLINCNLWPKSDIELFDKTVDKYASNEPFMTYYMTNSGHMKYENTWMYKKYKDIVGNLPYNLKVKGYLASAVELDKALERLIEKLKENNVLDNTVIVLVADHYPYDFTLDEVNSVNKTNKDEVIEQNRNKLIIWNSKMEKKVIEKIANQIDVIPTVYNLFGINYDSRLFMGKDILSTEPGLAFFKNRSWVSDYGKYYSKTKEFVPTSEKQIPEDYVKIVNGIVGNRINMSRLIFEQNYYAKLR